jgi:hypothetical protein
MDKKSWHKMCLEKIPHGEEGQIDLSWDDAVVWAKILNRHGYAVLFTGGEMDGDVKVSWLYAGTEENLDWADYDMVTFTSPDYLEGYPDAVNEEYGEEENENEPD